MTLNDKQQLVFEAVDKLNTMARAAYDGMEVHPATTYGDGLFTAEFAQGWESINFVGDITVWCAETELCDTPENGETVASIVAYVWMEELRDLTTLLVAFGKQCESGDSLVGVERSRSHGQMVKGLQALLLECPVGVVASVRTLIADYLRAIGGDVTGVELQLGDKAKAENAL